eukprot:10500786-Alexandrium_andersonii.AAC.1
MSASLVGSEMCIRDRILLALPVEPFCRSPRPCSCARRFLRTLFAGSCDCLLYTSDAADDM